MKIVFVDRESAYPNRYLVTPDNGTSYYVLLERADEPVTPGTPLNAETFNGIMAEIEGLLGKAAVPLYGPGDYGKVLSCSEKGLVWINASVGLYNAEGVGF